MAEATTQTMDEQRAEIIAAMQNMAVTSENGEVRVGDVVFTGDDTLDTPMIVALAKSAGVSYIYDTRTGERSRTNNNMLPTQMSKVREDGSRVFSLQKPDITPVRASLKCLLHPDLRQEHPEYDRWGLQLCNKSNLASRQDVKSHMVNRHKREWATIEDERIEREKAEDRQMQRDSAAATQAALATAVANGERAAKKAS